MTDPHRMRNPAVSVPVNRGAIRVREPGPSDGVIGRGQLTGDPIRPKIILATNHQPIVEGDDHAIWRRVHLTPFAVRNVSTVFQQIG